MAGQKTSQFFEVKRFRVLFFTVSRIFFKLHARLLTSNFQIAINEAERYKSAVSNLETQAKLAESQISSIKNQLEQKTAQLDEAQVRKRVAVSLRVVVTF